MIWDKLLGISTALASGPEGTVAGTGTTGTDAGTQTGLFGGMWGMLIFWVLIIAVFYFLMIRPQRKKDKKVKEMLNNLKAGDRICTIGGIYGTITGIKDDTVTLSVGRENMTMVVARWGIRSVEEVTVENDAQELN